jgi:hypothetical protein
VELQAAFFNVQNTQFRWYLVHDFGKHPRHGGMVQPEREDKDGNGNRGPSAAR